MRFNMFLKVTETAAFYVFFIAHSFFLIMMFYSYTVRQDVLKSIFWLLLAQHLTFVSIYLYLLLRDIKKRGLTNRGDD